MSRKRGVQEINAGSMADIAFLLLIFFLVTTTMDKDEGMPVKLTPWNDEPQEVKQDIREKNILVVLVNINDELLVEDDYMHISELRQTAKDFIDNNGDGTCEHCNGIQDPKSSDNPRKAVISLQNDRQTSYEVFVMVRNELTAAYSELREELSQRRFGKAYGKLDKGQRKEINAAYPQVISEAEPVKL